GLGEADTAAEADFAPARIFMHRAACRDGRDLQAPAASENRRLRAINLANEFDLRLDRGAAVVNMERRACDGDPVIALEPTAVGQVRAGVGGKANVDRCLRPDFV